MSVTAKITSHLEVLIDSELIVVGSDVTPSEVTIDGEYYQCRKAITNTSDDNYNIQTLWETGDGGLDSFDILCLESEQDVILELRNDADDAQFAAYQIEADVPFILTSDDLLAQDDGSSPLTDGSGETLKQIDRVRVKNDNDGTSADVTANVRLVLLT